MMQNVSTLPPSGAYLLVAGSSWTDELPATPTAHPMSYFRVLPTVKRRKACEGKRRYDTRSQAKDGLKAFVRMQGHGHPGTLRAYKCEFCAYYHFGHQPQVMPADDTVFG